MYSTTLTEPSSAHTRIERDFVADDIRRLKETSNRDLGVGGPGLAAHAFRAGLVDECQLIIAPVIIGGGTRSLPDGVRLGLELQDTHPFACGMLALRYARTSRVGRRHTRETADHAID